MDAYNLPFFSFETPLPPLDPVPADGANGGEGGRRKRRRGRRNDRHSKIRTTHGLRDRRMRLSVDIASRFFALQDMLGFEKASATIDWLLKQSKPAIERAAVRASVVSSGSSSLSSAVLIHMAPSRSSPKKKSTELSYSLEASDRVVHSAISRREWRAEARARARSRTIEKKMLLEAEDGGIDIDSQLLHHSMEKVPSPVGSDLQAAAQAEYSSSSSSLSQGRKLVDGDINTKEYNFECLPIVVDGESSPLCMFGYHQSKDFSLIFNDTDASYEPLHITRNFSVEPEYQNLLHKKAEISIASIPLWVMKVS